jgi:hypothetical protein
LTISSSAHANDWYRRFSADIGVKTWMQVFNGMMERVRIGGTVAVLSGLLLQSYTIDGEGMKGTPNSRIRSSDALAAQSCYESSKLNTSRICSAILYRRNREVRSSGFMKMRGQTHRRQRSPLRQRRQMQL